jgi:Protein of unknown function (DUF4236)
MGFRFYKSFKLFPGVRLNLSKSGISASVGIPGANVNFNSRGTRTTFGIPGSGLSHTTQKSFPKVGIQNAPVVNWNEYQDTVPDFHIPDTDQSELRQIQSEAIDELSSTSLRQLIESTKQLSKQRSEISVEIERLTKNLHLVAATLKKRKASVFRYFYRKSIIKLNQQVFELSRDLSDHKVWLKNSKIGLQFSNHPEVKTKYGHVVRAFDKLRNCQSVWDITADKTINKTQLRSAADKGLMRTKVSLNFSTTDFFSFTGQSMQFENANGENIQILPELLFLLREDGEIAFIEIKDLEVNFSISNFIEEGELPSDSLVVGKTWSKVNKNGMPDLRFNNNYEIPICRYGEILFKTRTGLFELYQTSNAQVAEEYVVAMQHYIKSLR